MGVWFYHAPIISLNFLTLSATSPEKIAEPATITLAPASRTDARFPAFTPPSISISVSSPLASNKLLNTYTLSSDSGIEFSPPNPGLTLITRTISTLSR